LAEAAEVVAHVPLEVLEVQEAEAADVVSINLVVLELLDKVLLEVQVTGPEVQTEEILDVAETVVVAEARAVLVETVGLAQGPA
jgi:hypothetical protein